MNSALTLTQDMTAQISPVQVNYSSQQQHCHLTHYSLKWRQDMLLVRLNQSREQLYLPALESQARLIECLKNSPVKLISLDSALGETELQFWADAGEKAGKKVFIKIPGKADLSRKHYPLTGYLKPMVDWTIAAILFSVLSPLMVGLALLVGISSDGPIFFQQWRVGKRGRLFRILKFRTMVPDAEKLHHQVMNRLPDLYKRENDPRVTPLGRWISKYNLDELPQLINVLRGEMSLVGARPCAIYKAVRLSLKGQQQLNAQPGMIQWQVGSGASVVDFVEASQGTGI